MNTRQIRKLVRWLLSAGLLLAVVLFQAGPTAQVVWAASFEVSNLNDSGAGSLRQAITNAQAAPGADTITFSVSGTITLASILPPISDPAGLTIDGAGRNITISGNNVVGVMFVLSGAPLTVKNLTIANSAGSSGIFNYGGILTVTDSTFSGNSASSGGAISNFLGTVTVTGSTFSDNSAAYYGGGISNGRGSMTITGSTFSANNAAYVGGGIYNTTGSTLTVTSSTFSANSARGGGGIANDRGDMLTVTASIFSGNSADLGGGIENVGPLAITNSTFSANSAVWGGGIENIGPVAITNSTFSANSAVWGGGGINHARGSMTITGSTFSANSAGYFGGGIFNVEDGVLTVTDSTFSANSAGLFGGSIRNYSTGTATLKNTIIANSPTGGNCFGSITDGGYNLDNGTSCGFSAANHSYPNTNPLFDPDGLKDNGGPTQTIALQPGSPAIDAIPNGTNGCGTTITTDQRGFTRPQGSACDIGAFELQNQPPVVSAGGPYNVDEGTSVMVTASGSDPEGGPLIYAWDLDQDGSYETAGQSATFSAVGLDGPGSTAITVQVTDNGNLTATSQAMVNILNVAPTASFTNTSGVLIAGQSAWLAYSNQFDPSTADTAAGFLYSYDCTSDGVFEPNDPAGASYACAYTDSGVFTATGRIQDKDGGFTDYTVAVTVLTPQQATEDLIDQVRELVVEGVLNQGQGNALITKLEAAIRQMDQGNYHTTINQLQAFINQVEAMINSDTLSWDDGQPLIDAANEIIAVLSSYP